MKKLLLSYLILSVLFCCLIGQYGYGQQAPNISYTTPQSLTINVALSTAISPTNTGGAVPAQTYGAVTTFASGLTNPGNIATDPAGNVYVCEVYGYRIKKITPAGVVSIFAGQGVSGGAVDAAVGTNARFSRVDGITIDAAGTTLYVSDYDNKLIRKILISTGAVSTFATSGSALTGPAGLDFDNSNNLYVADQANHTIKRITSSGVVSVIAGTAGASGTNNSTTGTSASFNLPSDVDFDGAGNLIVSDQTNNRIRKVSLTAPFAVTTIAGSTAGYNNANGTAAQFNTPNGLAIDGANNYYVADYLNNDIRKVTSAGTVSLFTGSATQASGSTNGDLTTSTFNGPYDSFFNPSTSAMFVSDYNTGNLRKIALSGYTISPALPAGLSFNATNGQITGTPTALSPATDYTITAYNYYGSDVTTLNLAVVNVLTTTDANTAGNGITQGILRPGQSDVVLFGFGLNANSSMTISSFKLNTVNGTNGPGFYFTNGRLFKNTTGNTYSGAVPVSATVSFTYNANTNPGITVSGISESFTQSSTPVYYFIVADISYNFNTLNAASQSMQFKLETTQIDAYNSTNTSANSPKTTVNGTNFTIAPPTLTSTTNNFTANGITSGSLSYGQTNIVLFSFKMVVDGIFTINQFDIPSNISVNPYFQNGQIYRSTTQNFSDAQPITATVAFNGTNTAVTGMTENFNSYSGTGTYYYFLLGNLTNTNAGTGPLNFSLSTSTNAFTQSNPYKQYPSSSTVTGLSFTVLTTYKWVGTNSTDFNAANNYLTLNNNAITTAPGSANPAANIYIPNTYTRLPGLTANLTVGAITFDGNATPTLSLNGRTLTLSNSLNTTANTVATINGTGTVALTNAALTSDLGASSILNMTGAAALTNAGTFIMASTSALNLTGNSTATNTGTFTLLSAANGTASIGPLSGTSRFTGTFVVQRYFTGGSASNRNWRLMSSPVNNSTTNPMSGGTFNFLSLKTNLLFTGAGGTTNGFDASPTNGPTVLTYNVAPDNFTVLPAINTATTLPVGTGFYFYFRGDNVNNISNKTARVNGVYATPEANLVGLQTGTLNQGSLTYNLTNTGKGYNLVGNPYPSAISVPASALSSGNTTGFVYTYSPAAASLTANTLPFTIASGQGFFVKTSGTTGTPTITFAESYKTTAQPSALLFTSAAETEGNITLQLKQDSVNYDIARLRFADKYKDTYFDQEDADDLNGSGQTVFMGAMTSDSHLVAIASQPINKQRTSVSLSVNDSFSGLFSIKRMDLSNIPAAYDVWLIDHFKKDSLDLRVHDNYNFNIDKSNAATFGNSRFEVVIRKKVLPPYKLLNFVGNKSATGNLLDWNTLNEYDYTTFELQKSTDGKNFETIQFVQSASLGSYNYKDINTANQDLYYRLKQTDINDQISYSNVVIIVSTQGNGSLSIFPNPATNSIQFSLNEKTTSSVGLRIFNSMGILMKSSSFKAATGQQDITSLTPGSYTIELIDLQSKKLLLTGKFIKL